MPDRRVLGVRVAGRYRAHHGFAGVDTDTRLDWRIPRLRHFRRVAAHLLLHAKCRIERALRMILMRDRRAEQREDAITSGLHDVAVVAMGRIDHQLEGRIDDGARLLGIESSIISIEPLISANSAVTVLRSPSSFSGALELTRMT